MTRVTLMRIASFAASAAMVLNELFGSPPFSARTANAGPTWLVNSRTLDQALRRACERGAYSVRFLFFEAITA